MTGFQRPLVATDMWKLDEPRLSGPLADKLMDNFNRRKDAVEAWNKTLDDGTYQPSALRKGWWRTKKTLFGSGTGDGRNQVGLAGAISDTFFYQFWSGGFIKIFGDVAQVLSPLVTKALIQFATSSYYANRGVPGFTAPSVGVGVGLAIALWVMQIVCASLVSRHDPELTFGRLALGAPVLLPLGRRRCHGARRAHRGHLPQVDEALGQGAHGHHERQAHQPHLNGRVSYRLLRRVLPHELDGVRSDLHYYCPPPRKPRTLESGRRCLPLHHDVRSPDAPLLD